MEENKTFLMCLNKLNFDDTPDNEGHMPISATVI